MIDPDDEPTGETLIVDVDYLARMAAPELPPELPRPRDHGGGMLSMAYVQRIVIAATAERHARLGINAPQEPQ